MGITNQSVGLLTSGSLVAGGYIPPITGTYYHVCPGTSTFSNAQGRQIVGSSGNDGLSLNSPLDSLATAYGMCTSGAGDGIILWSYGLTTSACSSYLTTPLTWSKHGITCAGVCAPTAYDQRARVANASSAINLASLITLSGNNNILLNMSTGNFGTASTALGGVIVSGQRNYLGNVGIIGAGSTTPAQTTGANSLTLSGADGNTFYNCTIGTDTVDQDGSQAVTGVIKFIGTSGGAAQNNQKNLFDRCRILSYISYANSTSGQIHLVGSGDALDRDQEFRDCSFINFKLGAPMTTPPAALVVGTAPTNGCINLTGNTYMKGFAAYAAASFGRVFVTGPAANAAGGLSVVTPS